jgi:hypothetical protein
MTTIDIPKFINSIKSLPDYPKWVARFEKEMQKVTRLPDSQITYFLVYDLDDKKFDILSEYKVTYNQISLQICVIPPKKDKNAVVEINEPIF